MNKFKIITLVKLCAFFVFAGRAYQFYFFGAPFRAILWDESLLTPIVEGLFNHSWYDYATSIRVNRYIDSFTKICSFILLLSAFVCLLWEKLKIKKLKRIIVGLGLLILIILGVCLVKDKNYNFLQFFELSIQFAAPLVLLLNGNFIGDNKKLIFSLKLAIVLTFIPHGLFAMGLIYLPGHFLDMTIKILGIGEQQATYFLFFVGFLDVALTILLFAPRFSKYALLYMIFWGFLTALARLFAGFNSNFVTASIHGSAYLMIYRLSHGIIPLVVYVLERNNFKQELNFTVDES
ncbi:hypothetical protein [Winogradskyella sp.]|uniref:hypothetical protein n=1 Tax=Winogradskyella sp. TaxID=1883156 RepID=UPI003F6BEC53